MHRKQKKKKVKKKHQHDLEKFRLHEQQLNNNSKIIVNMPAKSNASTTTKTNIGENFSAAKQTTQHCSI